jgi:SAM-dependent methyltransferase
LPFLNCGKPKIGARKTIQIFPDLLRTDAAERAAAALFKALLLIKREPPRAGPSEPLDAGFRRWLAGVPSPRVIELGTRRTVTGQPTIRRDWAPPGADFIAADFMAGEDVDVVADAERLSETFGEASADAIIACSVFEHIRRPWRAAVEIARVLKPGGRVFVQTHFCYPLHGHPHDYWRFTTEALETLFCDEAGLTKLASAFDFPCSIITPDLPRAAAEMSFLNVLIVAEKPK